MSGFGAHYKGDVSEVTMGHETGLHLEHGQPLTFNATNYTDYTEIVFATAIGSVNGTVGRHSTTGILSVPVGMLIGAKLTFHGSNTSGGFSPYYYEALNGRIHSIVDHTLDTVTKIKIVPALGAAVTGATNDIISIHSLGMPTITASTDFSINAQAKLSKEFSLIDQFVGLASFMTLPDTTVDIHKYHVVGLGRQAAVQQTGKVHHMGGALEMPLHSPRWLYYSLGREVVDAYNCGKVMGSDQTDFTYTVSPGQTYIDIPDMGFGSVTLNLTAGDANYAIGKYILIKDTTRSPTTTYKAPELDTNKYWPPASGGSLASDAHHFEWAETSECRRIVAVEDLGSGSGPFRVFVDDPWQFAHSNDPVGIRKYDEDGTNGPHIVTASKLIKWPVRKLFFSADTIPSFCVEHSIRNRDVGSYSAETGAGVNAPGGSTDSKQLTRIFRGCKVVEWELSSTVDAELKYRCIFDALSCYTDTGRLESANQGDRYNSHRMFQNTATDETSRKASGIATGTEKPFMFYNGSVEAFGSSLGFISAFELRGKTGVEVFHTIQSNPVAESTDTGTGLSLKQVPYGGTRNASIIREGREEFEMEIDVVLTDATLFHQLRTHIEQSGTVGSTGNLIHLYFTKPATATADLSSDNTAVQSMRILLDDYIITAAPIPVPDDKGLLHSKIRLEPRNLKVISEDTLYHC